MILESYFCFFRNHVTIKYSDPEFLYPLGTKTGAAPIVGAVPPEGAVPPGRAVPPTEADPCRPMDGTVWPLIGGLLRGLRVSTAPSAPRGKTRGRLQREEPRHGRSSTRSGRSWTGLLRQLEKIKPGIRGRSPCSPLPACLALSPRSPSTVG